MQLNPEDPVVRSAVFGAQVQQFLDSDIGTYLVQCADEQAEAALKELVQADPSDVERVRSIQNKIKLADSVVGWLRDAIVMGEQAANSLRES
jgi:hypothetical protein